MRVIGLVALLAVPSHAAPVLRVPDGFAIERVAGPPLVEHPMMAGFDDRGRLFVAESDGVNRRRPELFAAKPHRMLMLEDTDGDGTFDRRTVFADRMVLPNGAQWYEGSLYVASAPYIWRLTDTDDDGVADRRETILGKFNFTGMSDSMHGPTLGPDGRFYFCGGQHGYEVRGRDDRLMFKGIAPGVFSCRPDGGDAEIIGHGGHANPVEVTFSPEGDVFGTLAIHDGRDGRHDALLHWVRGAVFNLVESDAATVRTTGDFLPPMHRIGQVAPAGNTRYRSTHLDPDFTGDLFHCRFNTHKVVRTVLERSGATYRAADHDFVVSDNIDFHPTDVVEDADGSLLVLDTGGWFRYGCPTSKIAKPNILGAIYRVRRIDGTHPSDPRGVKLDWTDSSIASVIDRLDDPRFVVRDRAIAQVTRLGEPAVAGLRGALNRPNVRMRRNAVWALTRIETPSARAALRTALADADTSVRQAAVHGALVNRDLESAGSLMKIVAGDVPALQAEAANALGRMGCRESVPTLLTALSTQQDRYLEHALIYALISINDAEATRAGLADASAHVRRAALIALDRMDDGRLTRDEVTALLDTGDAALQSAAVEVITKRRGWADEIVGWLNRTMTESALSEQRSTMVRGALLAFATDDKVQALVAERLGHTDVPEARQRLLLEVMAHSGLTTTPTAWIAPLGKQLNTENPRVLLQAVQTIGAIGIDTFDAQLLQLARNASPPVRIRVAALAAAAPRAPGLDASCFDLLNGQLQDHAGPLDRLEAARVLSHAKLDRSQLLHLAETLPSAGPLELPVLVAAFEQSSDDRVGRALVTALEQSDGVGNLRDTELRALLGRYPSDVRESAAALIAQLQTSADERQSRMAELASALADGNPARGRDVFTSTRAACTVCHRIGNDGGLVGPNLSNIGKIRGPRDLLEAIVFPSATFARGYQPYAVLTDDGAVVSGVISRETADAIVLFTAQRAEIRIERDRIEELAPDKLSIMPQGLDRLLSRQELGDLVAYLKSLE